MKTDSLYPLPERIIRWNFAGRRKMPLCQLELGKKEMFWNAVQERVTWEKTLNRLFGNTGHLREYTDLGALLSCGCN